LSNKTLTNPLNNILRNIASIFWVKLIATLRSSLKGKNRATNLQRHMDRHYYTRNRVSQIRIQNLKRKLKETLNQQNKGDKLELLVEASFID